MQDCAWNEQFNYQLDIRHCMTSATDALNLWYPWCPVHQFPCDPRAKGSCCHCALAVRVEPCGGCCQWADVLYYICFTCMYFPVLLRQKLCHIQYLSLTTTFLDSCPFHYKRQKGGVLSQHQGIRRQQLQQVICKLNHNLDKDALGKQNLSAAWLKDELLFSLIRS